MKTENKKGILFPTKLYPVLLIGILLAFIYWGFGGAGQLVNIPTEYKTATWSGNQVNLESPHFGSISSGTSFGDVRTIQICDSNDAGDLSFSNSFSADGNLLKLSSTLGGLKGCSGNYIIAKSTLPAGKIIGTYSLSSSSGSNAIGSSRGELYIDGKIYAGSNSCDPRVGGCNFGTDNKAGTFELTFASQKEIKVELRTSNSGAGSSSARVDLIFYPDASSFIIIDPVTQQPIIQPVGESSTIELTWIQKLNLWFEGVFQRIKELFR